MSLLKAIPLSVGVKDGLYPGRDMNERALLLRQVRMMVEHVVSREAPLSGASDVDGH